MGQRRGWFLPVIQLASTTQRNKEGSAADSKSLRGQYVLSLGETKSMPATNFSTSMGWAKSLIITITGVIIEKMMQ